MAGGSTKVLYAALAGNVLVALAKFVGAAISGSSAMLTEAIHSSADTTNQILLIVGNKRSRKRPDTTHDFGYGLEIYYWTFVVAMLVLLAGGAVSLYEGWEQLHVQAPIKAPGLSLGVLGLAALFEGASFTVGYREYKRMTATHVIPGEKIGLWRFIKLSKDPNLYESLLEDGAALIGIVLASAGVVGAGYLGLPWADGAASIAIGTLLVADSYVILRATQSLIGGEAVAPALLLEIERALQDVRALAVSRIATLHLGPQTILVSLTIAPASNRTATELIGDMIEAKRRLKAVEERITYVLFEFE